VLLLRTFGGISVVKTRAPLRGPELHGTRLALLSVLAINNRDGMSRDRLCELMWPDRPLERARGALKQALFVLRRELDERELVLGKKFLTLNPDRVECDVVQFETARSTGDFARAAELYRGPFLDGIKTRESPEFEKWADRHRDRLSLAFRCCLEKLACEAEFASNYESAISWWSQLSESDPFSSRIALRLMNALAEGDDRESAIRHGLRYQAFIRAELEAEPDIRVHEYLSKLRRSSGLRSA
jgi:DNA-binding SARP family transcriptional activator